ncbi:DUF3280 domain-containing protein [Marinivivus vitaminiproducens]|uniref:DUF3280 domain-containing protein n=1 Tax=Marinivivus vitaminiproducens TaxID=3035935 RepID=UPI0027A1282A|nr:DUF3280 domain-containing protein [Geminicoccaceae bacterium SCSIO 64248]
MFLLPKVPCSVLGLVVTLFIGPAAFAADPPALVIFPFTLIDTSLQGEMAGRSEAETVRLEQITRQATERLAQNDRFRPIDPAPVADEMARLPRISRCNGCELRLGRELGADLVLVGWVQKVSNLILNINMRLSDVRTGKVLAGRSVDIRGNDDLSWQRGMRQLLREDLPVS